MYQTASATYIYHIYINIIVATWKIAVMWFFIVLILVVIIVILLVFIIKRVLAKRENAVFVRNEESKKPHKKSMY